MYSSVFEQAVLLIGAGAACLAAIFAILSCRSSPLIQVI
jgi:hypothetical protein